MLTQVRTIMATSPSFVSLQLAQVRGSSSTSTRITSSVLPKLSPAGDFLAGGTARIIIGIILNPLSVLKARFESNLVYNTVEYRTVFGGLRSLSRGGPSELFKGVVPSAIRDAPYAGLFITFYEVIKRETGLFSMLPNYFEYQFTNVLSSCNSWLKFSCHVVWSTHIFRGRCRGNCHCGNASI